MNRGHVLLRILHVTALGFAVLGFGVGTLAWLTSHRLGSGPPAIEYVNLGGLLFGMVLGIVLLWRALHSTSMNIRATVILYVGWIAIFAWYWFNRFTVSEVHSFDPKEIAREKVQQIAISVCIFLIWAGLSLIGPVQAAARRTRN